MNSSKTEKLSPSSQSDENKKCAYCNRRGHLRESCFNWLETPDGSKWSAKNPKKAAKTLKLKEKISRRKGKAKKNTNNDSSISTKIVDDTKHGAWIMEDYALILEGNKRGNDVVLDTGASNHIFCDENLFVSMSKTNKTVSTASGESIPVSGIGSAKIKVYSYLDQNLSKVIEINDVWYVPSCTKNLVSGTRLMSKCFEIMSLNGGLCVVSRDGSVLATAKPRRGLFCFNTNSSTYPLSPDLCELQNVFLSQDIKEQTSELIHRRFAHVSPNILEKLEVSNLKIPALDKNKNTSDFRIDRAILSICDVCNTCKQVERINRGPTTSYQLLELIHSDTWGRCRFKGIFGSLYFVTPTDDFSRESTVYLMKSKSDLPQYFKMYREHKELQSGERIKALRFDGGSEYNKIDFQGITKQISAPYTQHQNGVSERMNRTLITMTRCMLSHARLPLRFWDAAVLTACYIRNRLPSSKSRMSPFEIMNGRKPVVSHLIVWGCICYALIDEKDPKRYKLKPTSLNEIFVGYCESPTQYLVYIPSKVGSNKVIKSANVRFLEDSFWDWDNSTKDLSEFELLSNEVPASINIEEDSEIDSDTDSDSEATSNTTQSIPSSPFNSSLNELESITVDENINNQSSQNIPPEVNPEKPTLRRSSRIRTQILPRSAWQPNTNAYYIENKIPIPNSYSEAINNSNKEQWKTAIDEEMRSLKDKGVFTPITHVPQDRKPVGSRWAFAIKTDGRFKARLVAQGFRQVYGVDYFDTYSPTLRMDSLRILLATAAYRDWEIHQIDVKTAYLEGDLDEEIFMRCLEGMEGTKFVKVNKALYGLKQSGRVWYEKLNSKLISFGFNKSDSDHCIYIHTKFQVVIGVYVDDLVICGSVLNVVVEIKRKLSLIFPIKDLGIIDTIIGWKVTRQRSKRSLTISQKHYLDEKIRSFNLEDSKPISTPLDGYDGILPMRGDETLADESAYASAVGSLGYATSSTRPDITFATSQLGSHNSSPVLRHWNSVRRVLRYLKGTIDYKITYEFGPTSEELTKEMKVVLYSDSDYASDIITRKSVSGYILMIGGGPICWQSKRQKTVSTSTAEAEYIALCEAAKQAVWVKRLLEELHVADSLIDEGGILTNTDNQSALAIANGANSSKTKHVDIAYHYVRECVNDEIVKLKYISTNQMLADILTKPLSRQKMEPICQQIFDIN